MSIGALTFLSPWLLAGLVALPVIYWLLRTVPPRPRQIAFPGTRILAELNNKEKTPDKTPWWLMLIRLLAAALIILALAQPVLNPDRALSVTGRGPIVLVVDNGWTSAAGWGERQAAVARVIATAEQEQRGVMLVPTADAATGQTAAIEAPAIAKRQAAALVPQPFAPDRAKALARIQAGLAGTSESGAASVVWFSDGIDHGAVTAFGDGLAALATGGFAVFEPGLGARAAGVSAGLGQDGKLEARLVRAGGERREGILHALSARGERLSEARFALPSGATSLSVSFDLPLELRNQVSRVVLSGERSAGAVHLLDARSKWNRIGLVSGANREQAQPLLGPLYYIVRALQPFAEVLPPPETGAADAIKSNLSRNATVLVLADIGQLPEATQAPLVTWLRQGGVMIRFAGPRLEQGSDALLPVPLRVGGRALGGALSWSTPQKLAEFPETSPFAGLTAPDDVLIRRQVLADPAAMDGQVAVWASLADGTPLVTARRMDNGYIVLFHITANSDWSNLPLSGLFVDMLRRIATLSTVGTSQAAATGVTVSGSDDQSAAAETRSVLSPVRTLDGFGVLGPPPATAQALETANLAETPVTGIHPPGYYGSDGTGVALNLIKASTVLTPIRQLPSDAQRIAYGGETQRDLKPWLLGAGLLLLFADILAVLVLQGLFAGLGARRGRAGTSTGPGRAAAGAASTAAAVAGLIIMATIVIGLSFGAMASSAEAQSNNTAPPAADASEKPLDPALAQAATGKVTFGYVLTGDPGIDATSKAGLEGLVKILTARTAVEPGQPVAVDIASDEIAFFPMLYWPVVESADELAPAVASKLDGYMKRGGMVIFDTRDFGQGIPLGFGGASSGGQTPLQRLLAALDIPRLEPVPEGHVLTKSFYLINTFPGRWGGGQLWVEATNTNATSGSRQARRADGVSSILITPNDFASAWALDASNQPLFPVVPGGERQREWAFRTGVNIVMYALTGNYKADQVHVPSLLQRLGQ